MRNPCRRCIVRAACSESCEAGRVYRHNASQFITFLGFLIAIVIWAPTLLWLGSQIDKGHEWAEFLNAWIWIIAFLIATIIQAPWPEEQRVGFFPRFLFAPFVSTIFMVFMIAKPFCKTQQKR